MKTLENETRENMTAEILKAARRPCPEIRESLSWVFGNGIKPERATFVFYDKFSNTTFAGRPYYSADEARNVWESGEDRKAADFRRILAKLDDAELKIQFLYWVKP